MDGLPAHQIVKLCKVLDPLFWQKRFEEDLVEVLSRSGCEMSAMTSLEVKDLDTGKTEILPDVPMTPANRQALLRAASTRPDRNSSP
jgi:hypothetical protein